MALTLDAIVRIAAKVNGTDRIIELTRELAKAENQAKSMGRASSGLAMGLGGLQSQLAGILSAGALAGFGMAAYKAGNEMTMLERRLNTIAGPFNEVTQLQSFAAESAKRFGLGIKSATEQVTNIYARLKPMGVSLEDIKTTFTGFTIATQRAGLSVADMNEALRQFGQAAGSGRLQGDELRSLLERIPGLADAIAAAYNRVAQSKGIELITRDRANRLIEEVRRGETRQTEILREQFEERQRLLRRETNARLRELQRRYARERQLIDRSFEDAAAQEEQRQNDLAAQRRDQISDQSEAEIKAIRRRFEDIRRATFANQQSMSENERIMRERQLQDQEEMEVSAIQDRADAAINAEDRSATLMRRQYERQQSDLRQARMEALEDQQIADEERIKETLDRNMARLDQINKVELEKIKENSKKQQELIKSSIRATAGDVKTLGSEGRITTEVMMELGKVLQLLKAPDVNPLNRFLATLEDIMTNLGKKMVPFVNQNLPELGKFLGNLVELLKLFGPILQGIAIVLGVVVVGINALFDLFRKMDPFWQGMLVTLGEIGAGFLLVFGVIGPLLIKFGALLALLPGLTTVLSGLGAIGSTILGLANILSAAFLPGLSAAFAGVIGWFSGTLIPFLAGLGPAIIAFFTGPAGWITLIAVALAGLVYVFREPIAKALIAMRDQLGKMFTSLKQGIADGWKAVQSETPRFFAFVKEDFFNALKIIQEQTPQLIAFVMQDLKKMYDGIVAIWNKIKEKTKEAFTFVYEEIKKRITSIINAVVFMVESITKLLTGTNFQVNISQNISTPRPTNQRPNVPRLASGGYATGRSLVEIAEAGQPEFVIPESKMTRAAINYLQGIRGVDVLNRQPVMAASGPVQVKLDIRPNVVSTPMGNYVTFEEALAIAQEAAAQTAAQLIEPQARLAYGLS